ncbi:PHO85 cyclin PHO80 [Candida viswanathii]|uniref:PHO85 cyclin PHO80 n=1 Tax=Candida viswanathii TaxID=5486 RepID=A0A367YH48_9ASCO|nr:PHO85 cyclin PHO80 [Candida viswanathii]
MMIELDNTYVKATHLSLKLHINLKGPNDLLLRYLKSPSKKDYLQSKHVLKPNRSSTSLSSKLSPRTTKQQSPNNKSSRPLPKKQQAGQPREEPNQISVPNQCTDCDPEIVIILINRMLTSLIKINDTTTSNTPPTRFHSKSPPSIQIFSYLNRLRKFNCLNPNILLTTIYYIDVLSYNYACFSLNSWTVHRFLLVATMIAQKALEDFFYTNDHYAKVGGVSLQELNCLELDFLQRIDWRTIPIHNPNVQQLYYHKLVEMTGKSSASNDDTEYKYTKFVMGVEQEASDYDDDAVADEEEEDEGFYDSDEDEDDEDDADEEDSEDEENILDPHEHRHEQDEMKDVDTVASEVPEIPMYKYDSHGFSIDGTSSPHLKRRYTSD